MWRFKGLKSITSKILVSYLFVVVCSTLVTTLSFHSILYGDLERRAKQGLMRQAMDLAVLLRHENPELVLPLSSLHQRPISVFLTGQPIESDYVVTNPQGVIVYSSQPEEFPIGKNLEELPLKLPVANTPGADAKNIQTSGPLLAVRVPIAGPPEDFAANEQEQSLGTVFTFAQISALKALNWEILILLGKSILIAIVIAVPSALLIARYLIKPLKVLQEYAQEVAKRRFDQRLDLKSDDELADLADSFNEMAEQLERYDSSMRRFFQGASHELKTPLMSIQGYAEGVRDGVFDKTQVNQALEIIAKECQHLKALVDELINITKLQSISAPTKLMRCDLSPLIEEAADSLRGYLLEAKVEINLDLQPELQVMGDPQKLQRLFSNLLTNAIRHASRRVMITATKTEALNQIRIIIQDDGEGFSPLDLKQAFDYFYKGPKGSTGLGLSIAQLIVQEHNGTIDLRNVAGGGALVEVNLPFSNPSDNS